MMNHQQVLEKKRARLHKYTGKALKHKTAAYERALAHANAAYDEKSRAAEQIKQSEAAGDPVWEVTCDGLPKGSTFGDTGHSKFSLRAPNEKAARAVVRTIIGVKRLPAGTKIRKV